MIDDITLEAKHGTSQVRITVWSSEMQYLKMWQSLHELLWNQY